MEELAQILLEHQKDINVLVQEDGLDMNVDYHLLIIVLFLQQRMFVENLEFAIHQLIQLELQQEHLIHNVSVFMDIQEQLVKLLLQHVLLITLILGKREMLKKLKTDNLIQHIV